MDPQFGTHMHTHKGGGINLMYGTNLESKNQVISSCTSFDLELNRNVYNKMPKSWQIKVPTTLAAKRSFLC